MNKIISIKFDEEKISYQIDEIHTLDVSSEKFELKGKEIIDFLDFSSGDKYEFDKDYDFSDKPEYKYLTNMLREIIDELNQLKTVDEYVENDMKEKSLEEETESTL